MGLSNLFHNEHHSHNHAPDMGHKCKELGSLFCGCHTWVSLSTLLVGLVSLLSIDCYVNNQSLFYCIVHLPSQINGPVRLPHFYDTMLILT